MFQGLVPHVSRVDPRCVCTPICHRKILRRIFEDKEKNCHSFEIGT